MTHEVYVTPKNKQAGVRLRRNFQKIDDNFREIHDQNFMYNDQRCEHGLELYDKEGSIFAHAYAHWDYDHLMATKSDARKAVKKVLGSTKEYKIRESF